MSETYIDEEGNKIERLGFGIYLASKDEIEAYRNDDHFEKLPLDGFEDFCKIVGGTAEDIIFLEDRETGEKAGYIEENVGAELMKAMAECLRKRGWTEDEVQEYLRNGSEA